MALYHDITEMIGNTPLLELTGAATRLGFKARVLAKLERANPAGSAKDRAALSMITKAEARGDLKPGATIIEPTSGNTGIGLALIAARRGYRTILTMPETMSIERRKLLAAYGAQIVLTPGDKGMSGAIAKAEELARTTPGAFMPRQFDNPDNPAAHYETTGPEIWRDTDGNVDILVATVGTGGTITGTSHFLKEKNPALKVVAVEPATSAVLSGRPAGAHKLQGIGAGFVPKALDTGCYDEVLPVEDEAAFAAARNACRDDGILVGISSGAALAAAFAVAARPENLGKTIVVILPDTGERYLSTPVFTA